jgi:hypothetical protein
MRIFNRDYDRKAGQVFNHISTPMDTDWSMAHPCASVRIRGFHRQLPPAVAEDIPDKIWYLKSKHRGNRVNRDSKAGQLLVPFVVTSTIDRTEFVVCCEELRREQAVLGRTFQCKPVWFLDRGR